MSATGSNRQSNENSNATRRSAKRAPLDSSHSMCSHVKRAWISEDECTYPRLPAGRVLVVDSVVVPSERLIVTRGSLRYKKAGAVFHQCSHYANHAMCNRGELCNFVHVLELHQPTVPLFEVMSIASSTTSSKNTVVAQKSAVRVYHFDPYSGSHGSVRRWV